MGWGTCVEREPGAVETIELDVRPSLREHRQMNTPGLVIDGELKSAGRIPAAGDIAEWLVATS